MLFGLIGYGKMGQSVEKQAVARGHSTVVLDPPDFGALQDESCDCAIDFTHADYAPEAIVACFREGIPVVSGTTGWNAQLADVKAQCRRFKSAFCWAPNFSVGMQITFHINKVLAQIMERHGQYEPEILEIHHTSKKDSPSGTAIALAEDILREITRKSHWVNHTAAESDILGVISQREADIKGVHRIVYKGPHDTISLRHHALSRDGFALGAVLAAEWISGKTGVFEFPEILGF